MDSKVTEGQPLRRSTRRSSVFAEPTPRGPLKRTKKKSEKVPAVNGSKDVDDGPEDGESPNKKIRLETEGEEGGDGDEVEMEVQNSAEDLKKNKDQDVRQDSFLQMKSYQGAQGDVNFLPRVDLGERCRPGHAPIVNAESTNIKIVKPSSKGPVAPAKSALQIQRPVQRQDVSTTKITSMAEYKRKMEAKGRSSGTPSVNHHVSGYPASTEALIKRRHVNNLPDPKDAAQRKKQDGKKKAAVIKKSSGQTSRGFMWYLWRLVLLVLLSSAVFLAYKSHIVQRNIAGGGEASSRVVKPEMFAGQLSLLEAQFPSQQAEVWKRIKIHLEKHLKSDQPTEPVSLILTAGLQAERSLYCLAQGLASSYSSALNTSYLHIDGASKASQDSDEVKLDIDSQLLAAFEGDKPVAVIHRFEELPPGSTLIFYRYCDHENAAYKRVFLLFTVLLPQKAIGADVSLKDVEEMVHDYVKERLVGSSSQISFNEMDNDKFSGLWSRISHLILPVVSETVVEQKGC